MLLATIIGSVTATRKTDALSGYKFLLVRPRGFLGRAAVA